MDKSKAREIVKKVMPKLQSLLGLDDWNINISLQHIDADESERDWSENYTIMGSCLANHCYNTASITIDHELARKPKELVDVLRHEMLHIFHSDFNIVRDQVKVALDEKTFKIVDEVFCLASEKTVSRIESMLNRGLKITAKKMMEAQKEKCPDTNEPTQDD